MNPSREKKVGETLKYLLKESFSFTLNIHIISRYYSFLVYVERKIAQKF